MLSRAQIRILVILFLAAALSAPGPVAAAPPATLGQPEGGLPTLLPDDVTDDGGEGDEDDDEDDGEGLPLEPERTLALRLREGTWISVDVSPDGGTVVFDLLGDLYTVPLAGGEAVALTRGMAFDAQPRFSPDGTQVLFTSDRSGGENLWILTLGEDEPRQVTRGDKHRFQSPEWTPDGDYVIASRGGLRAGPSKPWMYHVDGGSGIQLVKEPKDAKLLGAAFGADERHVWFARRSGRWQYNAQFPQYQLAVFDRDRGRLVTETARPGSAFRPTLSPDGRWLVYGTRHDAETGLRLRDLESGEERWLVYPVQHDEQEARASRDVLPGMSFTPDSRELVASARGRIWRFPIAGGDPVEVPFEVSVELELGPRLDTQNRIGDEPTFTVRQIRDAVPSPDGMRLAFVALDRVWLMELPDGEPRRLTSQDEHVEHEPAWSPDGRRLAFATWDAGGGHLRVARARPGSRARRVTRVSGFYADPAWSPDGERLVALRGDARVLQQATGPAWDATGVDVVWVSARGGAPVVVAPAEGRHSPHFTDDPDRIWLFHGERGLVSIQWDGTDERAHLKVVGAVEPRSEKPIGADVVLASPDGRRALAQVLWDLYVVELPRAGAEAPQVSIVDPGSAAVPVRKLTTVGGQFPVWGADSRVVHWSIGNAHFRYDLAAAELAESEAEAREAREDGDDPGGDDEEDGEDDGDEDEEGDDDDDAPAYEPEEIRIAIAAERDIPRGDLVLRGGRVITMVGDRVIEDADVVIHDNRIAAVGRRGTVSVPDGARVLDVTGTTIVPGFVDTHAHMWPSWDVHKPQVWQYLVNLAYGVTTTHDPQTATTDVLTYADHVESGAMLGPRIYHTGPGIFWTEDVRDLDHARDVVRRYADYYGTYTIKMYVAGNRRQRQWILQASHEMGLRPTTEGALNTKLNLTQIIDGYPGQEHNFPNFPIYSDVLELVVGAGTVYTPTLLVTYGGPFGENHFFTREEVHDDAKLRRFTPHFDVDRRALQRPWFHPLREKFDDHAVFVRDLLEAGGRAGVGSHGQLQGLGYHWELWAMASAGARPLDALRAATVLGAELIGLAGDLGTVERGKLADLLVLEGNPLEDLRHTNTLRHVMKNGRLYDADTLHELWPEERPLERLTWWEAEPAVWSP